MKIQTLLISLVLLIACTNNKPDEKAFQAAMDSLDNSPKIDKQVIVSVLEQIPSPLEISVLLKNTGAPYHADYLNLAENISKYNTSYKQALNLGVYGTDLGYTNIYEKTLDGIQYLSSIKSLANELNIGQFFDIGTISKLAANSSNLDSLLLITTQNFNSINAYLQEQGRENLSLLFLIGGWVEAMEITCSVAVLNPGNKELLEMIGAQKIILEQIVLLLTLYEEDQAMNGLLNEFTVLQQKFDSIQITYTYKESTIKVVDGVAVIQDNSTTSINITDQDIINIKSRITILRNKIVN
jgi:hypothetical protein